jgi:hypothetical protein
MTTSRIIRRMKANAIEQIDAADRLAALDWSAIAASLDERGFAVMKQVLSADECETLARGYANTAQFRSRVVMARHNYGRGEYQYFSYPLPPAVQALRSALYPKLADIGNRWNSDMKIAVRYPQTHAEFLKRCHEAGQARPTPLMLKYGADDYNCLHQDLYGEHVFPLQAVFLLSQPQADFTGGELVLTEQRPRMQSRVEVVPLAQGDGALFAVNQRPVRGTRGTYRVNMRHGVSRLISGRRLTLGIILHDSR